MSAYEPPIETVPEFDVLLFKQDDTPLTIGTASKLFLRFPNAQGEENLAKTNVSGLLTANGGIKTASIEPLVTTASPAIAIGTTLTPGGVATIKIGNTSSSTYVNIANMTLFGGILRFDGTGSITNVGSSNAMSFASTTQSGNIDIATAQTSGILNIGTGANRTSATSINIGTGGSSAGAVYIGKLANQFPVTGQTVIEADETKGVIVGNKLTTGNIELGQDQTNGLIRIGFGSARTATGRIDIGNNAGSAAPINIGKFIVPAPTNTNQTLTTSGNTAGLDNTNASGNCVLFSSSVSGAINFANAQTTGRIFIGTGNRNSNGTAPTGEIGIATGSATGSGTVGCLLNIGTGARTIYSDINFGTGLRDSTSNINIGYCATTGVNNGVLHLQDGDQNAANIHIGNGVSQTGNIQIANGASNSGNCNILTGASNSGDVNISTGATATGDVFIGNNANAAGVLQLNSRNIDIGTNGATNTVIALNNPLQPNYTGTQPTTIGNTAIGFQGAITATSLVNPSTTAANIGQFNLTNGVWMVEITCRFSTWQGGATDWLRMSCSTTSGVNDNSRLMDLVQTQGGSVYIKYNTIFTVSGGSTTIYVVFTKGLAVGTTVTTSILGYATRLA